MSTWEGLDEGAIQRFAEMINAADGPPEGVPSSGIMVLADAQKGRSLVIGLFDTEEDLRKGDEALRAMDRPPGASGEVTSVEFFEVTANRRTGD
ncbi:MAG: hypothetical protein JOZ73_00725 [Solirubrobacterales bacterium]|nr:hypothetical protein [Solirubrobacterales bacterium]